MSLSVAGDQVRRSNDYGPRQECRLESLGTSGEPCQSREGEQKRSSYTMNKAGSRE